MAYTLSIRYLRINKRRLRTIAYHSSSTSGVLLRREATCFLARQPNAPIVGEDNNTYLNYSLYLIYQMLADYQKILIDYSLPQFQHQWAVIAEGSNLLLIAKLLQYNPIEEGYQFTKLYQQLNANQVVCFNTIVTAIDIDPQTARFFLQGPIGTSKTFLCYYLYYYYRLRSKIILYIASSSIIALLLPSGCTTYFYFQIPLKLYKESTYNVSKSLNLAKLLRRTSLLIQDKILIQHYYCFKAVHYMLIDVYFNNSTFSRLPTVLGGNFT